MKKKAIIALIAAAIIFTIAFVLMFFDRKPIETKGNSLASSEMMEDTSDSENAETDSKSTSETEYGKSIAGFPMIPMN